MKKLSVLLWEGKRAGNEDWGSRFLQGKKRRGGSTCEEEDWLYVKSKPITLTEF